MRLYDFKSLFAAPDCDYLKFPEARAIVKQVKINPNLLIEQDLTISKSVKNLMIKDLSKCKKSQAITVLFLKVREFFSSLSSNYCAQRNLALKKIQDYANQVAKEILKN